MFQDILSTLKILDTEIGIEYDGLFDREFLELVNEIVEEKEDYSEIVKMNTNQAKRRHLYRLRVFRNILKNTRDTVKNIILS